MDKYFHPTLYWVYDYLSMLGYKLIHVDERWVPMAAIDPILCQDMHILSQRIYHYINIWTQHNEITVLCKVVM